MKQPKSMIRRACDKCHAQKLSCKRVGSNKECERCLRARRPCHSSLSLRFRKRQVQMTRHCGEESRGSRVRKNSGCRIQPRLSLQAADCRFSTSIHCSSNRDPLQLRSLADTSQQHLFKMCAATSMPRQSREMQQHSSKPSSATTTTSRGNSTRKRSPGFPGPRTMKTSGVCPIGDCRSRRRPSK
jgi:hypothetical protein